MCWELLLQILITMQDVLGEIGNASLRRYFKNLEFQWGLNLPKCKDERKEK